MYVSNFLIQLHCMFVNTPCRGQHVPHKLSSTIYHVIGRDRAPLFMFMATRQLVIMLLWLLSFKDHWGY